MNGKPATISRGDSIIIPATENVASTTIDATLSLTVTPTVSYNNFISLDIAVTDDNAPSATQNKQEIHQHEDAGEERGHSGSWRDI